MEELCSAHNPNYPIVCTAGRRNPFHRNQDSNQDVEQNLYSQLREGKTNASRKYNHGGMFGILVLLCTVQPTLGFMEAYFTVWMTDRPATILYSAVYTYTV